jgi:pilus assembly protein Flp/PilA
VGPLERDPFEGARGSQADERTATHSAAGATAAERKDGEMGIAKLIELASAWIASRAKVASERGATAVEYGIMIALIAAVVIIAVLFLGNQTSTVFSCTASTISTSSQQC